MLVTYHVVSLDYCYLLLLLVVLILLFLLLFLAQSAAADAGGLRRGAGAQRVPELPQDGGQRAALLACARAGSRTARARVGKRPSLPPADRTRAPSAPRAGWRAQPAGRRAQGQWCAGQCFCCLATSGTLTEQRTSALLGNARVQCECLESWCLPYVKATERLRALAVKSLRRNAALHIHTM